MSTEPILPLPEDAPHEAYTPYWSAPVNAAPDKYVFRTGTVVWGLLLAAIGVLLIVARQTVLALDVGQVAIWLLVATGAVLAIGGILRAVGSREEEPKN